VQYLDSTSFGVTPTGLLIDLKGFKHATLRMDTGQADGETFLFNGHYASSLEHEVWQKVTGLDAISTMRGFQTALRQGAALLHVKRTAAFDPIPGTLETLGFKATVPSGFTPTTYEVYGRRLYTWLYSGGSPGTAGFNLIRANANGVAEGVLKAEPDRFTVASGLQQWIKGYDDEETWLQGRQAAEGQLKTGLLFDWSGFNNIDIVKSEVISPSGFSVSAARKAGTTDTYTLTLNETSQHPDGIYTVETRHYLATPGKTAYDSTTTAFSGYTGTLASISTDHSAFTVTSNDKSTNVTISSPMPLRLTKIANLADSDDLVVQVRGTGTIWQNGIPYQLNNTPFASITYIVRNNRVIEATSLLSITGVDTSDNLTYTCGHGAVPGGVTLTGTPTQVLAQAKTKCFEADIDHYKKTTGVDIAFYDRNAGFDPAKYLYRDASNQLATEHPVGFLKNLQIDLYGKAPGRVEYLFPTRMPFGEDYLFNIYLQHNYKPDGGYHTSVYAIDNQR
jgi:hypothetical protein